MTRNNESQQVREEGKGHQIGDARAGELCIGEEFTYWALKCSECVCDTGERLKADLKAVFAACRARGLQGAEK